jgi:hypothetical protein
MGKSWKQAMPDHHNLYWAWDGNITSIVVPVDEDCGLFVLWNSDQSLANQTEWTASKHKPGWFYREEFKENLIFK